MLPNLITFCLGGLALGLAWLMPGTYLSAVLGCSAVLGLILPFHLGGRGLYLGSFLYGVIANTIAFHWLGYTLSNFGGFGPGLTTTYQGLFIVVHALPFPIYAFFRLKFKNQFLERFGLISFFAWVTATLTTVRLFPWHFGHTLSAITPLIQFADLGGAFTVSALMFFLAEYFLKIIWNENRWLYLRKLAVFIALFFIYGIFRMIQYQNPEGEHLKVSLIQADIGIEEKNNVKFLQANVQKYWELSQKARKQNHPDLIIWPESTIVDFIPTDIGHIGEIPILPNLANTNFIVGALSTDGKRDYNSAFGIKANKQVLSPYHKQILMPFGEYMPFADIYPDLKKLNPNAGDFSPGKEITLLNFSDQLKAGVLICYEDLLPSLSREASKKGATVLVNLTNDAWFGKSAAARQHNLIASFRAIETRRYLLRSTNTGLTSIVSPLGHTEAEIPEFSTDLLNYDIKLLEQKTIYTYLGDKPWWLITAWVILSICLGYLQKKKNE